jgi:hypothetical protein
MAELNLSQLLIEGSLQFVFVRNKELNVSKTGKTVLNKY